MPILRCSLFLLTLFLLPSWALADVVRLNTGGELRGKLGKGSTNGSSETVTIETLTGATVVVARRDVEFVTSRRIAHEEYELLARRVAPTVIAQWDLAQWCDKKGLDAERRVHLQRVIEFDPDHQLARTALGHIWKEGGWVDQEQYMAERGYVKHKGKFITVQELELIEKSASELKAEQEWFPKVRQWTALVTGTKPERIQQGLASFRSIDDPDAAPAIMANLSNLPRLDLRQLGVEVLTRAEGLKSARALTKISLHDVDSQIREAARQGIPAAQFEAVQPLYVRELRSDQNPLIERAARGLARTGDERAIDALIEALVTSHRYQVRVPGSSQPSYSFGKDGSIGAPGLTLPPDIEAAARAGLITIGEPTFRGPPPPSTVVVVSQDHQNAEVLTALQRITGVNYGYDERLWRLWWMAKKAEGGLAKKPV